MRLGFFHQIELSTQNHVLALRFWKSTKKGLKKGNQIYSMSSFRRHIHPLQPQLNATTNEPKTSVHHGRSSEFVKFFIPDDTPRDMIRVETPSTSATSTSKLPLCFKEVALKILDGTPTSASINPSRKRRKVNPYGDIVASDEQFEKAIQQAEAKEKKNKRKAGFSKYKRTQLDYDSSNNEIIEEDSDSIGLSESDDEDQRVMKRYLFPPISKCQTNLFLLNLWKKVNPSITEEYLLNAWFATRCCSDINKKKKPQLFVGKVLRQFLADTNRVTTHLQLDCLSPIVSKSATELHEVPVHLPHDIGLFETYNIISGPLDGIFFKKCYLAF